MPRSAILAAFLALLSASIGAGAQSISVYQTTPDLLEALSQRANAALLRKARSRPDRSAHHRGRRPALPGDRWLRRLAHRRGRMAFRQESSPRADRRGVQDALQPQGRHRPQLSAPAHRLLRSGGDVLLLRRSLPADRQGLHHARRRSPTPTSPITRSLTIRSTSCRCSKRRWPSIQPST